MEPAKRKYKKHTVGGKITVKHFLNTRLKPSHYPDYKDPELKNMIEYYPLYIRITVKRQTTSFPAITGQFQNDEFSEKYYNEEIETASHLIERGTVVIHEIIESLKPFERDDFDIKEVTDRLYELHRELPMVVNQKLIEKIKQFIDADEGVIMPYADFPYDHDKKISSSTVELGPGYNVSHLIDWDNEAYDIVNLIVKFSPSITDLIKKYPLEIWRFHHLCYCIYTENVVGPKEKALPYVSLYEWDNNLFQNILHEYMPNQKEQAEAIINGLDKLLRE